MSTPAYTQIEGLLTSLDSQEQLRLIETVAQRLRSGVDGCVLHHRPLHGILKGKVDEDFDIDAALTAIRSEWHRELDGNAE